MRFPFRHPFTVGERPPDLVFYLEREVEDFDHPGQFSKVPVADITGWETQVRWRNRRDTVPIIESATITDGTLGEITYRWSLEALANPGVFLIQAWAWNDDFRIASELFGYVVETGVGGYPDT